MSGLKSEPKEIRICFVGESFVNGTGDPEFLGWTGRVCANVYQKGYEITYYNLGVRAETSRYLKQRWRKEVSYRHARTLSSHNPNHFKTRAIGDYEINGTPLPQRGFF